MTHKLNESAIPGPYMKPETVEEINKICMHARRKNSNYIWASDVIDIIVKFAKEHLNELEFK